MNYKKKDYKRIIIYFVLAVVIVCISVIFKSNTNLVVASRFSYDIGNTIINIINKPINIIRDKINLSKEKDKIYNTYKILSANEKSIKLVLAENESLKNELSELKKLNNIETKYDNYEKIHASVIKRNVSYWDNTITIDKGYTSGIEDNMAVITDKGLIGLTTNVSSFYSDVKLITSEVLNPKVSVQIKSGESYVPGILYGYNKDTNSYVVNGISEYNDISDESYIYTTSYNENIPNGVLVGKVIDIKKDNYDLAKVVEMVSDVDFDNIRYVDVLVKGNTNV